eukprot:10010526-Karenia_brevis.AAC.1
MTTKKPPKLIKGCQARRNADGNTLQWVEFEERQLAGGMAGPPDLLRPSLDLSRFPKEPRRWGRGDVKP